MVIQSRDLPFSITFNQFGEKRIEWFHESEYEAYGDQRLIQLKENVDLTLTFEGEPKARFYMDGLDALPERVLEFDDEGESYLFPCRDFPLFRQDYYPLIPGCNLIKIATGGKNYYTLIKIIPTHLSPIQWQQMVSELEAIFKGLSVDLIRKNLGIGMYFQQNIPSVLLYRFMVILNRFPNIMASLSDLLTKVNYRIRKEYVMVPVERAEKTDRISMRYQSMYPENKETVKVPRKKVDYDLPENQWIKHMVRLLIIYIKDFLNALQEFENEVKQEITTRIMPYVDFQDNMNHVLKQKTKVVENLATYAEVAERILKGLAIIKLAPWYNEVSNLAPTSVSPVLMSDSRYFALYKLYKELQQEEFDISIDPSYSYQFKRTDKLYELWGFLQVCESLRSERLGFEPVSGWIYDKYFDENSILIPTLPSGSTLVYQKEDLVLRVTYDGKIPFGKDSTDFEHPVYTIATHTTPDGKIDFFKAGTFIGSIIFDTKCRKLNSFYNEQSLHQSYRSRAINQLVSYGSQCRSKYSFGVKDSYFLKNHNIVHEVWVFYPSGQGSKSIKFKDDHNLRFIKLCPGDSRELLEELVDTTIKRILYHYSENALNYQRQ